MFSKRTLAFFSLIFVALGFSLMGVASRWMDEGFGNFTQVFLRLFGALVIISFLFRKDISLKKISRLKPLDWLILLAIGVLGYALMVYSITKAYLLTNLVSVSVLYSTVPFWVYLYGLLMARQKFSLKIAALLIVSSWGIGTIVSGEFLPRLGQFGLGEWLALSAAALDAVWYMGIKLLENRLNSREITFLSLAFAALATFFMRELLHEPFNISAFSNWHVSAALLFGILQNGWVTLLMAFSLKHLDEVFVTQFMLLESIFALGLGYFIYQELINPTQLLGTLTVISSVFLMNKLQRKSPTE